MQESHNTLRAAVSFLRATVIGGLVFLLPFGVILLVVGRLYSAARPIGQGIHETLFPQSPSNFWPIVFAVLLLVGVAFLAGVFSRSQPGRRSFEWLESTFLSHLPPYTILRQMIGDYVDGDRKLSATGTGMVVSVRFDDYSCVAFLIERGPTEAVIFLPGAPSATSGSVAIVSLDRIGETDLTPLDMMRSMRQLGLGLGLTQPKA